MTEKPENIHTQIWDEESEPDNPFAARVCYCHGYDVYGDILGKATWIEYLFLLFKGERPTPDQAKLLEALAVAIANPGIRDHSVRAAMNGGVGGSNNAACLMAALAVGAGQYGGAHEVAIAIDGWESCGTNLDKWKDLFNNQSPEERADVWMPIEHPPGFDPHGASCPTPVLQMLKYLSECSPGNALPWLYENREQLEKFTDCPLAMTGVAAAALYDLRLNCDQAEMLFLILRLPGSAVHAIEQSKNGWRKYPFFNNAVHLEVDPKQSLIIQTKDKMENL